MDEITNLIMFADVTDFSKEFDLLPHNGLINK